MSRCFRERVEVVLLGIVEKVVLHSERNGLLLLSNSNLTLMDFLNLRTFGRLS